MISQLGLASCVLASPGLVLCLAWELSLAELASPLHVATAAIVLLTGVL